MINDDVHLLHQIGDLRFVPRAVKAMARLAEAIPASMGKIIIVTNQAAIARGLITEEEFADFNREYLAALSSAATGTIRVDDVLYCPHHPTRGVGRYRVPCECRKPSPGMLRRAAATHGIDLESSFMIGDKRSDVLAGQACGCFSILVRTGYGGTGGIGDEVTPDATCADLFDAAELVLGRFIDGDGAV